MLLVTGAAGHIGNAFIRNLLEHGYTDTRALLLYGEDAAPLAGLPIELVEGDITRPESLAEVLRGVRHVAHLASLVSIGDSGTELVAETLRDTAQWWLEHPALGGKRRAG